MGKHKKIAKSNLIFDGLVNLVMILVLLVCLLPFIYMIAMSLSDPAAIMNNEVTFWPKRLNLSSYRQIFSYPNFFRAYGNTFFYTICGTAFSLLMMIMLGYPLSKDFLRGNNFFMKMVILTMFFSGGLIPNYLLISYLRLTGTRFALLIPFAINQFNLIILINFFKTIPVELEEAALIDGMSYWKLLWKIVVPLSKPAIATIGLYSAVFFWNDWFNSLIYLNSNQYPVMLYLRNIVNGTMMVGEAAGSADKSTIAISVKAAVIIVSTLPIICIYPFLQKYFVKGMTVGSVKG
ncbi:carbohydrate ABC transporter permease [Parablautia muri]|uniref:Carbohydrate ABC transporter permease n=1 Tax=Parablautia muri TaxID=2320879 RepID=A0A9X5GQT0_9FIRM|nr:carbohydrate ABC transporter permease [Parablautia muri]NBJ91569.1 carbohydrate ABC transporter permease [Parablautia muri]